MTPTPAPIRLRAVSVPGLPIDDALLARVDVLNARIDALLTPEARANLDARIVDAIVEDTIYGRTSASE